MDSDLFADAQRQVGQLLAHLEEMNSALDLALDESGAALPDPFPSILRGGGYLQGLYLKAQGFLSADLQEFIRSLAYSFELEVAFPGAFKLPFVGGEVLLQRKTLNPFREAAWELYHAGLLSAYAMQPLAFSRPAGSDPAGFDLELRVTQTAAHPEAETPWPRLRQRFNGLDLLAEEILREKNLPQPARDKIQALRAAVAAAAELLGTAPAAGSKGLPTLPKLAS